MIETYQTTQRGLELFLTMTGLDFINPVCGIWNAQQCYSPACAPNLAQTVARLHPATTEQVRP